MCTKKIIVTKTNKFHKHSVEKKICYKKKIVPTKIVTINCCEKKKFLQKISVNKIMFVKKICSKKEL